MSLPPKDPSAKLDYGVNWADWFLREGVTSANFTWAVPTGIVEGDPEVRDGISKVVSPGTVVPNSLAVIWLSSGTDKEEYRVTCHLDDAGSEKKDERSITIYVQDL